MKRFRFYLAPGKRAPAAGCLSGQGFAAAGEAVAATFNMLSD